MRRTVRSALAALLALAGATAAFAQPSMPVDRAVLSGEARTPFLVNGAPPAGPRGAALRAAAAARPDAESCLRPEARGADPADLLAFDWAGLRSLKEAQVCLFRLADTLGSPQGVEIWMAASGLGPIWSGPSRDENRAFTRTAVSGLMTADQAMDRTALLDGAARLHAVMTRPRLEFAVRFAADGSVHGTQVWRLP